MSAADTWMPLYVADFLTDTTHLNTTETGAYLLVLMGAWVRDGKLPNDDAQLARIARCQPAEWLVLRPILEPFFEVTKEWWLQHRLLKEKEKALNRCATRQAIGRLGGRPKAETNSLTNRFPAKNLKDTHAHVGVVVPVPVQGKGEWGKGGALEAIERFWQAYPNKTGRGDVEHAFTEVNALSHIDAIMHAIQVQKSSEAWLKEGGRFIPSPARWLRDKRWLDQPVEAAAEQEEYGTPWAVHFGIPKRNGWLLWTRESAGPQREQFGKQPDQERLFKIARETWQQWAKISIQARA